MTLAKIKKQPVSPFGIMWDDFFGMDRSPVQASMPPVNIRETENGYQVELSVPGFKKEDLVLNVEENVLSVKASSTEEQETKEGTYTRREFRQASFERRFTLPEAVDAERIAATTENGVLMIDLPKKEEALKKGPRTIQIS